jgi:two-component system sensor histidine kinase TctE
MAPRSLRLQLLAWLLVPLAGIVLVNGWIAYRDARAVAGIVTDRTLLASARSMAEQIQPNDGVLEATVLPSALEVFALEPGDRVYYRIEASGAGGEEQLIAGSADLPLPPSRPAQLSPIYYDASFRGQALRLVTIRQPVAGMPAREATIVVGETLGGRERMVADLWRRGFLQQCLLVLIAGLLAWLGLQRGFRPLLRLRDEVIERRPDDLRPFSGEALHRELQPLVAALNEYMGRVKSWSAVQRRFIANAAHQLRTPLTLLSTQATYALRAAAAADKDEALRAIQANMQQMRRLSNQLLTLAAVEPGGKAQPLEPVDLVAIARRALESLVGLALERDMDLGFDAGASRAMVTADPTMLQEMVANLVENALRYTPPGGVVTVGIDAAAAHWRLTVRDSGPGIPPEERERVFERFYRVLGTGSEGSGLGLAIVREIVERVGGTIALSAAAADGRGLLVTVLLPGAETSADGQIQYDRPGVPR